jgi:hypothetical protein
LTFFEIFREKNDIKTIIKMNKDINKFIDKKGILFLTLLQYVLSLWLMLVGSKINQYSSEEKNISEDWVKSRTSATKQLKKAQHERIR